MIILQLIKYYVIPYLLYSTHFFKEKLIYIIIVHEYNIHFITYFFKCVNTEINICFYISISTLKLFLIFFETAFSPLIFFRLK